MDLSKLAGGGKRKGGRTSRSARKSNIVNGTYSRKATNEKGVSPPTSSARSEEGHTMVLDPDQNQASCVTFEGLNEGALAPKEGMASGLPSPSPIESGLRGANTAMEAMLFGASEDSSAVWGSHGERESGVMSSSEEKEGRDVLVMNGNGDGGVMGSEEGRGSGIAVQGEEEVGSTQADKLLDWDLGGIDANLWDETGEMWPWQWGNRNGELVLQGIEGCGYQEESLDSCWLVSDIL